MDLRLNSHSHCMILGFISCSRLYKLHIIRKNRFKYLFNCKYKKLFIAHQVSRLLILYHEYGFSVYSAKLLFFVKLEILITWYLVFFSCRRLQKIANCTEEP